MRLSDLTCVITFYIVLLICEVINNGVILVLWYFTVQMSKPYLTNY